MWDKSSRALNTRERAYLRKVSPVEEEEREREEERARRIAAAGAASGVAATVGMDAGLAAVVGPLLAARYTLLVARFQAQVLGALGLLGGVLATAYLTYAAENPDGWLRRQQLANRVLDELKLKQWLASNLAPLISNLATIVAADTANTLSRGMLRNAGTPDQVPMGKLVRDGNRYLHKTDLEPQLRKALNRILEEALAANLGVQETAQRIRQLVPAGRFKYAGMDYRASLIAREIVSNMQREAVLSLAEGMDGAVAIEFRDGIYGPPRSDEFCISRDHMVVPIREAKSVRKAHLACTLGVQSIITNP